MTSIIQNPFDKTKNYKDGDIIIFIYNENPHLFDRLSGWDIRLDPVLDECVQLTILLNYINISPLCKLIMQYNPGYVVLYGDFKMSLDMIIDGSKRKDPRTKILEFTKCRKHVYIE